MSLPWKKKNAKISGLISDNENLIKELEIYGITQNNILHAVRKVPRELFVEEQFIQQAYENIPLPIDCGQTISQPYVVAYMISRLNIKNTDKVLEIGTGTGYQTAILSHLCSQVYTIEIKNELLSKAKKRISKLNLKNVSFKSGNGLKGWEDEVLFDSIIISAACEIIPLELLKSLKNQGLLIMPRKIASKEQKLLLIKKKNKTYLKEELLNVKFVPLLNETID